MTDYNDLPEELLAQLSQRNQDNLHGHLKELFADGKQRSIDETLIDYWREYKTIVKRGTMASALADLTKRTKILRRCGKGVYTLNSNEES